MDLILSIKHKLPDDLIVYIYSFLDFTYNTYVITSTKKRRHSLVLITKPLFNVIRHMDSVDKDDIFFISQYG